MKNYKFIQIVKSFTKQEIKEFEDFVRSPYFNKVRDYSSFLKQIKVLFTKGRNLSELSPQEFYSKVFPGKPYSNKTLRNRLNELEKLSEKFLIQQKLEGNINVKKKLLMQSFLERGLGNIFESEFKKIARLYSERLLDSIEISEVYAMNSHHLLQKRKIEEAFSNYKVHTDFELRMLLERLFGIQHEFAIQKQYKMNPVVNIADDIMNNLNAEKLVGILESRNDPVYLKIILNYYIYKSLTNIDDEIYFEKVRQVFLASLSNLENNEKTEIFTMMNNYCINKMNEGKTKYLYTAFELLKIKLEQGLNEELKELRYPSIAFRDYVIFGVKLKEFDWVRDFIIKYENVIPREFREQEVNLAYARLNFYQHEIEKALEFLHKMKSTYYLAVLDSNRMKLMIYYDMPDFEEAFMELDRGKHFIKNNLKKVPRPIRAYSKEFFDKYLALLKLKLSPKRTDIEILAEKIKSSPNIPARDWFLEKILELGG